MKKVKKSRESIKQKILLILNKRPLSIQQLSRYVGSNWSTVSEVLQELREEGKVREIISTEKIKFYQKNVDTYYNIPISEKQKKEFMYLFSLIIEEYKNQKHRLPNRTELAKTAVAAIEHQELLLNLPTVWYIYGKIPLMVCDPSKEYSSEEKIENAEKIKKVVSKIVLFHMNMTAKELKKGQYEKYDMSLYKIKDKIINSKSFDKGILEDFNEFLVNCPTKPNMPDVFILTERFVEVVNKLSVVSNLEKHKMQILLTLESVWKYIALNLLFDSLTQNQEYSNVSEIMRFYLGKPIELRKECAKESISNLESIYLSELNEKEVKLDDEAAEVREIMSDLTGG